MSIATNSTSPTHAIGNLEMPGALRIGVDQARLDIKLFFRRKDAVFFTFLFPLMILTLFGMIFSGKVQGTNIEYSQVLVAGIIASGVASVTFMNLGVGIANERDEGRLKRLAGTPMPPLSYFIGKVGLVLVTVVLELLMILTLGVALFHLHLPTSPARWLTFAWVLLLGVIACTLLGIAVSSVPKSAKSAAAVVNFPFVALQFVSGVYISFSDLPPKLRFVGQLFPLAWMAKGFRSVFLPDEYRVSAEPGGSWQHPMMAAALLAWCIIGVVLCMRTFRWTDKD